MRFLSVVSMLAGLAAAIPTVEFVGRDDEDKRDDGQIKILSVDSNGSGCDKSSVTSKISVDQSELHMIYSKLIAKSGKGVDPQDYRKFCQNNIEVWIAPGKRFTILEADNRGYCALDGGVTSSLTSEYYFPRTVSCVIKHGFEGPRRGDDYRVTDIVNIKSAVYSPCGKKNTGTTVVMGLKSSVAIQPQNSDLAGQMTLDTTDLSFTQIYHIKWENCKD